MGSRKIQLKAMNNALAGFADKRCKEEKLSPADTNTIMQKTLYEEPYNSIEVLKSGKIYDTAIKLSEKITANINEIKVKD